MSRVDARQKAPAAPLRLSVGLPPATRQLRWLPLALAILSAWSVGLTTLQSLAVAILAALPAWLGRDAWKGAELVLRPDGSAGLARGANAIEATATGRAWLLAGLCLIELDDQGRRVHVPVCSARNGADDWRRLRGWVRLGRLGAPAGPERPAGRLPS